MSLPPHAAGKTVLVLEDEFLIALWLGDSLEAAGVTVAGPFATVADARNYCRDHDIDLAVLDVNVRGESSVSLASELVAGGIPCIFITGYSDFDAPAELATVPRLLKPVETSVLHRCVGTMLGPR